MTPDVGHSPEHQGSRIDCLCLQAVWTASFPTHRSPMTPPQFEMLIFSSILIYVMNQIAAQLESAMGSNLDEQRKETLPQCPGEWQWACRNGECIARYDTCDGIPQCSDGSDEWNCDQWRQKQDHEQNNPGKDATRFAASTQPSTTTTAVAKGGYVVLSTREMIVALAVFVTLAVLLVLVIRRRARIKALARNRRGNLLQADSDEDDILISSNVLLESLSAASSHVLFVVDVHIALTHPLVISNQ